MKKNIALPEKVIETTIIASEFDDESGQASTYTRIWQQYGYLKQQSTDFNMKKRNYPENSIIYINQAFLTVKNNKKNVLWRLFFLGQIIEAINPP